jgi:hypothetical protein
LVTLLHGAANAIGPASLPLSSLLESGSVWIAKFSAEML